MTSFEADWGMWFGYVRQAFLIAKGERLGELRGRRVRRFDDRGLHPYSEVWGYIGAATTAEITTWLREGGAAKSNEITDLLGESDGETVALTPVGLRRAAEASAMEEFREELLA